MRSEAHRRAGPETPGAEPTCPPAIPDHRLLRLIGRGAYGEVWLAENAFGTRRAVKVVARDELGDARAYERELEGIRQFEPISRRHEGLVDVLQVGHNAAEGWFYYVMELADNAGEAQAAEASHYVPLTLSQELQQRERLPLSECMRLGLRLTEALGFLHEQGLVHRDIKPSNVVFVQGTPKLADIGLVTRSGEPTSVVGTEGYIAPEGPGAPPADFYSLGKVLYEMATGRDRRRFPDPPTGPDPGWGSGEFAEFNQVVVKACEPDPRRRYQSAAEMRRDLLLLLAGKSIRQVRALERRVARFRRATVVAAAVLAVLASGWWFQHAQTSRVRALAEESRRRLVRLNMVQGLQQIETGDYLNAVAWFAEALALARTADEERLQRYRIGLVRRHSPALVRVGVHERPINHAAFSSDGARLLTTSDDGTACVWDLASGEVLARFTDHGQPVQHGSFSPDGNLAVTGGGDGAARVWEVRTGRALFGPLPHAGTVFYAWFSPDGRRILTASEDGTAKLWDANHGRLAAPPLTHAAGVNFAGFSPDGTLVATSSADNTARVWETATGRPATPPLVHPGEVSAAAFSPEGRTLATGNRDHAVRLWEISSATQTVPPLRMEGKVRWVCFSPDGSRLLTAGGEHTANGEARVWDPATGAPVTPPLRHRSHVSYAAFSPDGRWVVTASSDETCRLWNAATGAPLAPHFRSEMSLWFAEFSPDGCQLVVAGREPVWRLWRLPPEVFRPTFHAAPAIRQRSFTAASWRTATNWMRNLEAAKPDGTNQPLAISPDGRRTLTANDAGFARVWDSQTAQPVSDWMRHEARLWDGGFSPDGCLAITAGEDRTARIWHADSGLPAAPPLEHAYAVWHAVFSPDGSRVLTGSREILREALVGGGEARLWRASDGQPLTPVLEHLSAVSDVAFSRDGTRAITACGNHLTHPHTVQVWDGMTGRPLGQPMPHPNSVGPVRFSPDEVCVVSGCADGVVRRWDLETGKEVGIAARHPRRGVEALAFSADGRLLATGGSDGTARLWDWRTGEPVSPPLWHGDFVYSATFSPEGNELLVQCDKGIARLWDVAPDLRPVEDVALLCQVNAGVRLDESGVRIPLLPAELQAALRRLQTAYPTEFRLTD